jgi:hypothetical protein
VIPPYRDEDWQRDVIIVNENDAGAERSANWSVYRALPGYDDSCLVTTTGSGEWIEYSATVPEEGWYELYVYNVYQWNAHPQAPYVVYSANDPDTVLVQQNKPGLARWFKLGDYYYEEGEQVLLRLTDDNLGTNILFADAVMLISSRRLQNSPTSVTMERDIHPPSSFEISKAYPNPFNSTVRIDFELSKAGPVSMMVYDISGQVVQDLGYKNYPAGMNTLKWDAGKRSSGIYFLKLQFGKSSNVAKLVLVR